MIRFFKIRLFLICVLAFQLGYAQFTLDQHTTNIGGGAISGGTFTSEVAAGDIGGRPRNNDSGFYLGFPSFNLKTAIITVETQTADAEGITDDVDGYLFRVFPNRPYDTLGVITGITGGNFSFPSVFLGNYLTVIDSDPSKYVASYYKDGGEAFEWEEADTISLREDRTVQIVISEVPPERNEATGEGVVSGTIDEDFTESAGRITARRRAAQRKCGLKKRRSGGRTGQDGDEFDLIAYGETNDQGEFEYGFLPVGTYRFFVEYPGIPLNESSFVQFDVGEAGVTDDSFVLAVFVDEGGIDVELILGLTKFFFEDFQIYPNPTTDIINISYDKILSDQMWMEIVNVEGKQFYSSKMEKGEGKNILIDLSTYPTGQYFIQFIDAKKEKNEKLVYRLIKK